MGILNWYAVGVVSLAVVVTLGCNGGDSTLAQQKLLLETIKVQHETLATLDKRKQEVGELEKAHEKRARKLEEEEIAIREREKALESHATELKAYEKKLTDYHDQINNELGELRQERVLSSARAEFARKRLPFLEKVARDIASLASLSAPEPPGIPPPKLPYNKGDWEKHHAAMTAYYCQEFKKQFIDSGVIGIQDDDEFEDRVIELAKTFASVYHPLMSDTIKWIDRLKTHKRSSGEKTSTAR